MAQHPTNEQEWRSEIQKVQREHGEASSIMWGGVALGVGGVILSGFSSKQKCVIGSPLSMLVMDTVVIVIGGFWDLASGWQVQVVC
jgi:hypothetical protein